MLFAWLVWSQFADINTLLKTLREGRLLWVMVAIGLQILYYVLFSGVYWSAFRTVEVRSNLMRLVPLTFASIFVNSTVTSGGAAGTVLFVDDARHRGESTARATAGTVLVMAADYSAFALLLTIGLVSLIRRHDVTRLEGISALVMYLLIFSVFAMLSMGLWSPNGLRRVLTAIQQAVEWVSKLIRRPSLLHDNWAEHNANEFISTARTIVQHPVQLLRTASIALLAHLADLSTLYILFWAFHQPVTLSVVIVLYAMTILFWIVSPTPNGIGVIETVMPAIYTSVGLPLEAGTVINLAFRGISFWLPLLVGFLSLRLTHSSRSESAAKITTA